MFAGIDVAEEHSSRSWTAIASFTAQATLVGAALVYPILYPQTLSDFARHHIFAPMPLSEVRTTTNPQSSGHSLSRAVIPPLIVTRGTSRDARNEPRRAMGFEGPPGIPDGPGAPDGVLSALGTAAAPPILAKPAASTRIIHLSTVTEGMLVRRIEPRYPAPALIARIEGPVKIKAIISREGIIEHAEVLSGNPLLSGAALDAIRQWRYRPYILNGEPVEVETEITVNFVLGR